MVDLHITDLEIFAIMPILSRNIPGCVATYPKGDFCDIAAYFAHKATFTDIVFLYYDKQNCAGASREPDGAENCKGVEL